MVRPIAGPGNTHFGLSGRRFSLPASSVESSTSNPSKTELTVQKERCVTGLEHPPWSPDRGVRRPLSVIRAAAVLPVAGMLFAAGCSEHSSKSGYATPHARVGESRGRRHGANPACAAYGASVLVVPDASLWVTRD